MKPSSFESSTVDPMTLLGSGLYSPTEAAQLIRTAPRKVHRWLHGVDDHWKGRARHLEAVTATPQKLLNNEFLTFESLIELLSIAAFRQHGVSMQAIRLTREKARELYSTEYPFASRPFYTDGKVIFATLLAQDSGIGAAEHTDKLEEVVRSQFVFDKIIRPCLKNVDFVREHAKRYWPLGRNSEVLLDAERNFGKPIVTRFSVPTIALYRAFLGEHNTAKVAKWYEVSEKAVSDAVEYERKLSKAA